MNPRNLSALLGICLLAAPISQEKDQTMELHQIMESYAEFKLKSDPTFATYIGDHRYDDKLKDSSERAFNEDIEKVKDYLAQSEKIDAKTLSESDRTSLLVFQRVLRDRIEGASFKPYLFPISQQEGPHITFPEIVSYHPFNTPKDYENYIARLNSFPKQIDDVIAGMKKGVSEGLVPARINIEETIPQIKIHIVTDPTKSEFYKPAARIPADFPQNARDETTKRTSDAIRNSIVPAYQKLLDFVEKEYLPEGRKEAGIWSLPRGDEWYKFLLRANTTTDLTPQQIFDIGKKELEWIHRDMNEIKSRVGFQGTLPEFIQYLRTSPKFYYSTKDSLLDGFRQILRKMDARMPELFGRLPKSKLDVKEIEDYRADAAPDAYYYAAPVDFSRPAYVYVNPSNLNMRPKYTVEALAYHEGIPGHHLQGCIQQEMENLPKFRRFEWFTVFGEGWALYSEFLPKELGFYSDPYSDFGRLTLQAWRATRLVVDPGIHHFKWTREQAIDFFKANTGLSEHNIIAEVDRYIAWPGQAISYKIGQLKIKELREKAQKELGNKFDIRAFHDELLEEGCLPLDILEKRINDWIAEVKSRP
ncbi:MAG: DUF885 domain-containing protein [Candidatus Eisenbacteria bacterium]|nr:DUF885 domain-containing protein [Candidatus Eisenbacteria bacterium]